MRAEVYYIELYFVKYYFVNRVFGFFVDTIRIKVGEKTAAFSPFGSNPEILKPPYFDSMNAIRDTVTETVFWDSGLGGPSHQVQCRLIGRSGRLLLEVGRIGGRLYSLEVPRLHPYDYPLWLTSVIAQRCKSVPESHLLAYENHLWRKAEVSEPLVTICFGPRRAARHAQQLHLSKRSLSKRRIGKDLVLRGEAAGERYSPDWTRKWTCTMSMSSVAEAKRLLTVIDEGHHPVVDFGASVGGIRATNAECWLAVGFSKEQMRTFARKARTTLHPMRAPNDVTLAFRVENRSAKKP